jgi:hypothetical protein
VGHFIGVDLLKKVFWLDGGKDLLTQSAEMALALLGEAGRKWEELIDVTGLCKGDV